MPRRVVSSDVDLPPFQELIEAHGPDVHRFLVAMVGSTAADDYYQETWISALRAYPRLRDAANLRGWLLTIAHRKALDRVRARARRPVPVGDVPELAAVDAPSYNGQDDLWRLVRAL